MPKTFRKLETCRQCGLPVPECDALAVARGVALRYLREYEGYGEDHACQSAFKVDPLIGA
jgi:hypothetical protein